MRLNKLMKLIFWIVLLESIGFVLGLITQANLDPWYTHLNKSSLTPPGFVFSAVWALLYGVLGVISWILSGQNQKYSKKVMVLFALQMLMNWLWTPLFFGLHWFKLSAFWLVSLTCLNAFLIVETKKTHKTISWLLTLMWSSKFGHSS